MNTIYIPWIYTYNWLTGSWTEILGPIAVETASLTCEDIQTALQDVKAPDSYPIDCDFITLSGTWVVFFMEPTNQTLVQSIEISTGNTTTWNFTKEDIDFIYSVETGFLVVLILLTMLMRNLRKIGPKLFK